MTIQCDIIRIDLAVRVHVTAADVEAVVSVNGDIRSQIGAVRHLALQSGIVVPSVDDKPIFCIEACKRARIGQRIIGVEGVGRKSVPSVLKIDPILIRDGVSCVLIPNRIEGDVPLDDLIGEDVLDLALLHGGPQL